jgi:predicted component of type VI protein secretion system
MKFLFLLTAKYSKTAQRNTKGGNLFSATLRSLCGLCGENLRAKIAAINWKV